MYQWNGQPRRNGYILRKVQPSRTKKKQKLWTDQSQVLKLKLWLKNSQQAKVQDQMASQMNSFNIYRISFWFSHHSVVSNSLGSHGLQHTRLPCPSLSPGVCSTHVHWVGDAIQPSCPLSSPSPPVFNLSLHQDLFQWVSSSHQVAKVLEFQLQYQSFQWIFRVDFL